MPGGEGGCEGTTQIRGSPRWRGRFPRWRGRGPRRKGRGPRGRRRVPRPSGGVPRPSGGVPRWSGRSSRWSGGVPRGEEGVRGGEEGFRDGAEGFQGGEGGRLSGAELERPAPCPPGPIRRELGAAEFAVLADDEDDLPARRLVHHVEHRPTPESLAGRVGVHAILVLWHRAEEHVERPFIGGVDDDVDVLRRPRAPVAIGARGGSARAARMRPSNAR